MGQTHCFSFLRNYNINPITPLSIIQLWLANLWFLRSWSNTLFLSSYKLFLEICWQRDKYIVSLFLPFPPYIFVPHLPSSFASQKLLLSIF